MFVVLLAAARPTWPSRLSPRSPAPAPHIEPMYALDPRQWDGCGCDDGAPMGAPAAHHDAYVAADHGFGRRPGNGLSCSCSGAQLMSIPQLLSRIRQPVRSL